MVLLAHYDLELHQMDVKTGIPQRGFVRKRLHGITQKVLSWKKKNVWDATCRNPFMD